MTTRTLVIWNPNAGGVGDADATRTALRETLRSNGVEAELFESPSEDSTDRRVEQALADGVERIVAAGGDGTVRSIAFKLAGSEAALGILPLGTAMNVARSADIPLELDAAAAVLASGAVRAVDVGLIGERPFLEVATIGLAAELLADATRVSEGRLRYMVDLVRRALRHRRTRVWLDLDGREVRHRVVSLAIANGPFTGRAMAIAPDARVDDGRLDVVCFLGYGPFEFLKELLRASLGVGSGTRTARYRAAQVTVRSHHPLPVRADSTDIAATPVTIGVREGVLRLVVPRAGDGKSTTPRPGPAGGQAG